MPPVNAGLAGRGLADRVLVLSGGVITFATPVTLDRPRDPADPEFLALRARLLAELGVPVPRLAHKDRSLIER